MDIPKKKVHSGAEARKKIMEAVDKLADVVGSTMGAKGRNVICENSSNPFRPNVINDGVKIAREFFFDEPVANAAIQLVKESAIRTNDLAGDGTTGATVLARAILTEGFKAIDKGANPVLLRKELQEAASEVEANLKGNSIKVDSKEQVVQIAKISVQDDVIGKQIGEVMHKIGKDGAVSIQNGLKVGVTVENVSGTRIKAGFAGGLITNPERWEAKWDNVRILVMKDSLEDHEFDSQFIPFARQLITTQQVQTPQGMQEVVKNVNVPNLVIIAEKLPMRVIQALMQNKEVIHWVWVHAPSWGDQRKDVLLDICALTGAKLIDHEEGVYLNRFNIEDLGTASSITVDKDYMTLTVGEPTDKFLDRVNELKGQIENADDESTRQLLVDRLNALTGGVATIKVGAPTEPEAVELKLRIEDAVNATRSAMEEGIVAGGGVALINAIRTFESKGGGWAVLKKACQAPCVQILENAGYDDKQIKEALGKIFVGNKMGIDVLSDKFIDMVYVGIVDPLKVIRHALLNAVSVAGLLLTAQHALTIESDKAGEFKKWLKQD